MAATGGFWPVFGLGKAMVYPTLHAAVSDVSRPSWRARSLSVYRFWRDLGYAIGALCSGAIADVFGVQWGITVIGGVTFASGAVVALAMSSGCETRSLSPQR